MKLYILYVVFIIEYLIKKNFKKNLYELWRKRKPNLKYLKVWGCLVKVNYFKKRRKIIGIIDKHLYKSLLEGDNSHEYLLEEFKNLDDSLRYSFSIICVTKKY